MKTYVNTLAAAALALAAASPVLANSQLVASAGLTAEEAQGLTLSQIAAAKANRDVSYSDRQAVVIERSGPSPDRSQLAASVGLDAGASLNEIAAAKYNRDVSYADRQIVRRAGATVASRSVAGTGRWTQLIASAGLTPEQAEGMTLNEIAAAKYNRDVSYADRQKSAY